MNWSELMYNKEILKKELLNLLSGKNAHATFEKAVADFPVKYINEKVEGINNTAWELVEHMRIAQWDILDFINNPEYKMKEFPAGYWPKEKTATSEMWNESIQKFENDFSEFVKIINNPQTDFFSPIPHVKNYTIYREILVVSNHNSYHTGQLILMRKILGIW